MKKLYILFLFLFMELFLVAQSRWVNYTYTNTVTCLERTGTFWWAGTTGGLIRYDTVDKSVTLYNRGNSEIPADYINDLTVDDNGTLWVATHNGLARYEGGRQFSAFGPFTGSLYSDNVLFVRNEKGKGLWVATDTALTFYDGTTWLHYFEDNLGTKLVNLSYLYPVSPHGVIYSNNNQVKLLDHAGKFSDFQYPGNSVSGMAYDGLNQLYVSPKPPLGNGFYEQSSQWDHFTSSNSPLANDNVFNIKNDPKFNVYFLHQNGFTMKTASGNYWNNETSDNFPALSGLVTTAIYPDSLGALGLAGGLLPYSFTESYIVGYTSRMVLSDVVDLNKSPLRTNDVRDVIFRNGKKYIATRGVGVWDIDNHLIKEYRSGSTVLTNFMGAMDVDIFGRIWCADQSIRNEGKPGGFALIDHGKVTEIKGDSILGFPISGVDAIQWETTATSPDTTGVLWISYWGNRKGIAWYDGKTWSIFPDTTGAPLGFTQFVNDDNGVKWFATMSGIFSYDGKKLTSYWNIAPIHQVTCVAKDKEGNLWFGGKPDEHLGWKGGLAKFNGKTWQVYDIDNSLLPDNYVTSIAVDTTGVIWAGTRNGGILKMKWPHSQVISQKIDSPLDNDFIWKITVDRSTNDVWILNHNAGIFIFNEKGVIHTGIKDNPDISQNPGVLLQQNYPNPFKGSTIISYSIPESSGTVHVVLNIFNLLGQKINTLVNTTQHPGKYEIAFRSTGLNPGIYFYQLNMGNYSTIRKMLLTK